MRNIVEPLDDIEPYEVVYHDFYRQDKTIPDFDTWYRHAHQIILDQCEERKISEREWFEEYFDGKNIKHTFKKTEW